MAISRSCPATPTGQMISTSFITAAGLKKWVPTTCPSVGRPRHGRHRQDGGVCGQDRLGLAELSSSAKIFFFRSSSPGRLDDEVGVLHGFGEIREVFRRPRMAFIWSSASFPFATRLRALLDPGGSFSTILRADVVETASKPPGRRPGRCRGPWFGSQNGEFFTSMMMILLGLSVPVRWVERAVSGAPSDEGRKVAPEGWRPVLPSLHPRRMAQKSRLWIRPSSQTPF
jgi:hypothetical protein